MLEKGYEVHGLVRRTAKDNLQNIKKIINEINLHYGDLSDPISIQKAINLSKPNEIYNEADQDHAGISFNIPSYNFDVTGSAVGRILEIIKNTNTSIKFFQPVTSNMFGSVSICPQNEETPFFPLNPYACAKFLHIICAECIEKTIIFLFLQQLFTITSLKEEQKIMLQEKSQKLPQEYHWGYRIN